VILYLDTSALVKLYVEEAGSPAAASWVAEAGVVATARIAYAEARAAFARQRREGGLTAASLRRVVAHLDDDWVRYAVVEITDALVRTAGRYAERYALRGFDALHLAAAAELRQPEDTVAFASFDRALSRAARRERMLPLVPAR
jgi:predicted nucleic acid-binding protein